MIDDQPLPLKLDQERWGVALGVIEQHGANAEAHAIERMRHFANEGDDGGMRFWIDISRRIYDLTQAGGSIRQ